MWKEERGIKKAWYVIDDIEGLLAISYPITPGRQHTVVVHTIPRHVGQIQLAYCTFVYYFSFFLGVYFGQVDLFDNRLRNAE